MGRPGGPLGCLDSRAMNVGDMRRIAVVNRGEPAMRLIHAVREMRLATGADLSAIALHTTAERAAMFVRDRVLTGDMILFDANCLADADAQSGGPQ